jgi:hypothetical protein
MALLIFPTVTAEAMTGCEYAAEIQVGWDELAP